MFHVITKDGTTASFEHPTVSTVSGDTRKLWQDVEGEDTVVAEYKTADIAATVDCQHTETNCVCVETVLERLKPVEPESEAVVVSRKLRSYTPPEKE